MPRILIVLLTGWIAGIVLPYPPDRLALLFGLGCIPLVCLQKSPCIRLALLFLLVLPASAAWKERRVPQFSFHDPARIAPLRWCRLEGKIMGDPQFDGSKTRFLIEPKNLLSPWPAKLDGILSASIEGEQPLEKGDSLRCEGRLALAKDKMNFGESSQKERLAHSGISCTFAVGRIASIERKNHPFARLRRKLLQSLSLGLPPERGRLFASIVFGGTSCPVSPEDRERYSLIGLAHILAASGLQVSLLIGAIAFPFKKFFKDSGFLVALLGGAAILGYLFLAGTSPSILRAALMGGGILLGMVVGRPLVAYFSFGAAALILLIWNPFLLFDLGFQFSFLATWALLHTMPKIRKALGLPEPLGTPLATVLAVTLWVSPLQLHLFGTASPYSILANLIAGPLVDVLTISGFVAAPLIAIFPPIHHLFAPVHNLLLLILDRSVSVLLDLPGSRQEIFFPSLSLVFAYVALSCFFLFPKDRSWMWGIFFLAGLNLFFLPHPPELTFLSVGQGDAIVCRTRHGRWILVDSGPKDILPILRRMGCGTIDLFVITHPHQDHQGGAKGIIENLSVRAVWDSGMASNDPETSAILAALLRKDIPFRRPRQGEVFRLDEMKVEVLSPDRPLRGTRSDANSSSVILKLEADKRKVLLTGDAEAELEKFLLEKPEKLASDILKVAHHGSRFGTSRKFLEAVGAKAGIISVGKNSFHQPDRGTLTRLRGSFPVLRTDEGAVRLSLGTRIRAENAREERFMW